MKIIGIDPDLKKCGVCELVDGEIVDLITLSPVELFKKIDKLSLPGYRFSIENVLSVNAVYKNKRNNNQKVNESIARKIGLVQATATIIIDYITRATGIPPVLAPAGIGRQYKRDEEAFKRDFGWQGRTNEDTRDAALIAFYAKKHLQR